MQRAFFLLLLVWSVGCATSPVEERCRVLVSTDIGGTDPDDNQSMTHLMMYSDRFELEGLISSPSYGAGSKEEILRMIALYETDYPALKASYPALMAPDALRAITKQGRKGAAPMCGYADPTEGSEWIVSCARKASDRPLYVLVWGGLEDLAQALHDAPEIADKIRVYWIGGPNKKFSPDAYSYIASHFPHLWFIECNAAYRGFIHNDKRATSYGREFYEKYMQGTSALADDFVTHCGGIVRMGDTPSVLYMLNYKEMDPANPAAEHWGGRFERMNHSSRRVFDRPLTECDTVPVFSIVELHLKGPERVGPRGGRCRRGRPFGCGI